MGLIVANEVYSVLGNSAFSLSPRQNESLLIKDIRVTNSSGNNITVKISNSTIGYFCSKTTPGNHVSFNLADQNNETILSFASKLGLFKGYPIAESETLTITGHEGSTSFISVLFDRLSSGDVKSTDENGTQGNKLFFVNYGYVGTPAAGSVNPLNYSLMPSEFIGFPFGERLPHNRKCTIHGICFSDLGKTTGTAANKSRTKYLQIIRENTFLFDINGSNGLPYLGVPPSSDGTQFGTGQSMGGFGSDLDLREPYIFPEPLVFEGGDEITFNLVLEATAGTFNISNTDTIIGLLTTLERK